MCSRSFSGKLWMSFNRLSIAGSFKNVHVFALAQEIADGSVHKFGQLLGHISTRLHLVTLIFTDYNIGSLELKASPKTVEVKNKVNR